MDRDEKWADGDIPQLVICCHGSIDDPDSTLIYGQTHAMIQSDIIAARLQPSDQLLNIIMRGTHVCLQLSHREGFEVKVTEALEKGVPVIAYKAGGIALQIVPNVTGFLIPIGDIQSVTIHLYRLFNELDVWKKMSSAATEKSSEEYFTIWGAIAWMFIVNELTDKAALATTSQGLLDEDATHQRNKGIGNSRYVRSF